MIGFELNMNGEKIEAVLESGTVAIIVTKVSTQHTDSIELSFTGLNLSESEFDESIEWYDSKLKISDEFMIKVKNAIENSIPKKIRKVNRVSIMERKLKAYQELKKELEEQGVIQKSYYPLNKELNKSLILEYVKQ